MRCMQRRDLSLFLRPFGSSDSMHLSSWHLLDAVACGVEERGLGDGLAQNVALDEVRKPDFGLVLEVDGCGDGKDLCEIVRETY
jgi:hypothetical protein